MNYWIDRAMWKRQPNDLLHLEHGDVMSSIEKALQAAQGEFIITTRNEGPDVREFSLVGSAYGDAVTYLYDTQDDIKAAIDAIAYRFAFDLDVMADALAVYLDDNNDAFAALIWYAIEQYDYLSD